MDKVLGAAIVLTLLVVTLVIVIPPSRPSTNKTQGASNRLVPADEIVDGGPPPDGIPPLDHPNFVNAANATFLADSDVVIGVDYGGDARAYPLLILVWHEIVNDVVGGLPLAITYCPLCHSTSAFVRIVNNSKVTFGTSGKLYNDNLVMYDRLTNSLWSQILGQAIAGPLTGYTLKRIPIDVLAWGDWKKLHADTLVLSDRTGFDRPYGQDPYGDYYYTSNELFFPVTHLDKRLPLKTIVWGLTVGNQSRAYPLQNLTTLAMDSFGGENVLLWRFGSDVRFFDPVVRGVSLTFVDANGTITDRETGSTWNYDGVATSGVLAGLNMSRYVAGTYFWFAWAAFYPDTTIYSPQTRG